MQVISDPHTRTVSGFQSLIQKEWVAAGHPFLQRLNVLQKNDRDEVRPVLCEPEGEGTGRRFKAFEIWQGKNLGLG